MAATTTTTTTTIFTICCAAPILSLSLHPQPSPSSIAAATRRCSVDVRPIVVHTTSCSPRPCDEFDHVRRRLLLQVNYDANLHTIRFPHPPMNLLLHHPIPTAPPSHHPLLRRRLLHQGGRWVHHAWSGTAKTMHPMNWVGAIRLWYAPWSREVSRMLLRDCLGSSPVLRSMHWHTNRFVRVLHGTRLKIIWKMATRCVSMPKHDPFP